jgi:hypothetical protein
MSLTYRSTIPEEFKIVGRDPDGRTRVATATRASGDNEWDMRLEHPSGRHWSGSFRGENILDALGELIVSKDTEFKQDKARGDRPHTEPYDSNRRIENMPAPIIGNIRR